MMCQVARYLHRSLRLDSIALIAPKWANLPRVENLHATGDPIGFFGFVNKRLKRCRSSRQKASFSWSAIARGHGCKRRNDHIFIRCPYDVAFVVLLDDL